jgi:hypothetical protein
MTLLRETQKAVGVIPLCCVDIHYLLLTMIHLIPVTHIPSIAMQEKYCWCYSCLVTRLTNEKQMK